MSKTISPDHWNGWTLDPTIPALIYSGEQHLGYRIDLDRMLSNDDLVFWFVQIGGKGWPGGLDGFVAAVTEILEPHSRMSTLRQVNARAEREERAYTPQEVRDRVSDFLAWRAAKEERDHAYAVASANFD